MRLVSAVLGEPARWLEAAVMGMPGSLGRAARRLWLKAALRSCGSGAHLEPGCVILGARNISIGDKAGLMGGTMLAAQDGVLSVGDRVNINRHCVLDASAGGEIVIGSNVLIGPNVVLRASDHVFSDPGAPIRGQGHRGGKIVLEDDVWLAANVVVTSGVTIGKGAVIGAGSVVTRDIPAGAVAVGAPAAPVKTRA